MKRTLLFLMMGTSAASILQAQTFTKDVAPILQRNCQMCHRPGEAAPFSMLTYEQTRPWAKAMLAAVVQKKMPPWYADQKVGRFANDRTLSQSDIDTLVAWVNAGAPLGDPQDMPAPREFVEGWTISKPDVVFQLPKPFPVPATGIMEYQYVIIPTGFTKDTWVEQVQAAPTNYSIVHHIVAYVRTPGSNYLKDMPKNEFFEAPPAKQPPVERTMTLSAVNQSFKIPPGDPNYRVDASYTMPEDVTLLGLHPHMHMRGKAAEYRIVFADGRKDTLLNVPNYNWHWQLWYDLAEPLKLPKGTKLECTEHFDNSKNNPENPDPTKTVIWGQQTSEEMMVCMFNVTF